MALCLLNWFYLVTLGALSAALLFKNPLAALVVVALATLWLALERYRNRQRHMADFGTSTFHYRLLARASRLDIFVNRLSRGTLLGESGRAHIPRICVSSRGARSGKDRIVAIMRYRITHLDALPRYGEVVAGSYNGADHHPAWVHNFRAAERSGSDVVYNRGASVYRALVREVTDPQERRQLVAEMCRNNPGFAEKQSRTAREIPVFVLHPLGEWRWEQAPAALIERLTPATGPLGRALLTISDWF
jgi:deazaflavin-dependent oxidoreductase (nitroreductase family)